MEETFGFGADGDDVLDLDATAEHGLAEAVDANRDGTLRLGVSNNRHSNNDGGDDGDDDEDALLHSLTSMQLNERAERKVKPTAASVYGVRPPAQQ